VANLIGNKCPKPNEFDFLQTWLRCLEWSLGRDGIKRIRKKQGLKVLPRRNTDGHGR